MNVNKKRTKERSPEIIKAERSGDNAERELKSK
jgi:hypothetical protein